MIDDLVFEGTETVEVELTAVSQSDGVVRLGASATASISIIDDDADAPLGFEVNGIPCPIASFALQDGGDSAITDGGASLSQSTNDWTLVEGGVSVASDTVLSFDFLSTDEGEVHGVAFVAGGRPSSSTTFQLFGTQGFGIQDFNDYQTTDGVKTYQIPVGQYFTGDFDLVFLTDDDAGGGSDSLWSSVAFSTVESLSLSVDPIALSEGGTATATVTRAGPVAEALTVSLVSSDTSEATVPATVEIPAGAASASFEVTAQPDGVADGAQPVTITASADGLVDATETVEVLDADTPLDFLVNGSPRPIASFALQDGGDSFVTEGGASLSQSTNDWTLVEGGVSVASDTELSFDFLSTDEGEVHGIAFVAGDRPSSNTTFQLFGTQGFGIQDFNDYQTTDGVKTYQIPVGQYFTGDFDLVFLTDDDAGGGSDSLWSDVLIL